MEDRELRIACGASSCSTKSTEQQLANKDALGQGCQTQAHGPLLVCWGEFTKYENYIEDRRVAMLLKLQVISGWS